jgi:hypothetical protein
MAERLHVAPAASIFPRERTAGGAGKKARERAMSLKRWNELTPIDAMQAALALLLVYWTYRYAGGGVDTPALVSAGLIGFGLIVTAFARVAPDLERQDVAILFLGGAALVAPFVLGFADVSGAKGMHAKVGLVVLFVTGVRMAGRYLTPPGKAA